MVRPMAKKALFIISATLLVVAGFSYAPSRAQAAEPAAAPAPSSQIDWNKVDAEALDYFRTYLRFDTSDPPDDTSAAIAYLEGILRKVMA